ncbi:MAG: hypothetical protein HEQ20_18280 [Aphanizomenon flos-aquae KM1D3_PB]|nr:MAG: hypothetical protein HEQ20_18280 [Aphanizomenon flos-aquae KM1D3_PB]
MKLHKLSHLLLLFFLLFPDSPIIITGCISSLFARKPGILSDDTLFIEWANDYRHYLGLRQELC